MARFFPGKKDASERGHVDTTVKKNKFNLFRRGRSETPGKGLPEAERITTKRKTQSYRISVYEVRSESPTTTCSSTDVSDSPRREATLVTARSKTPLRGRRSPSPKARHTRSGSPLKHLRSRSKSPSKSIKTDLCVVPDARELVPQRTFSEASADRPSPRRGILKRASYSMGMGKANQVMDDKPQPVASFDLEMARATSLTDNMSADSPEERTLTSLPKKKTYSIGTRDDSFVIHPKRTVSFSKDVLDPKPQPSGVASLCLGTRSGRKVPRRRSDFSLFHEFEDLCYDLTYFCRCFASEDDGVERRTEHYHYAPTTPEDDHTHDDSTYDEPSLDRSVGSI